MNGYNFTDRVRRVLQMAREEAANLGHEYVGTEHLLLAVIRDGEGVAMAVLANLSVDFEVLRQNVLAKVEQGDLARCHRGSRGSSRIGGERPPHPRSAPQSRCRRRCPVAVRGRLPRGQGCSPQASSL